VLFELIERFSVSGNTKGNRDYHNILDYVLAFERWNHKGLPGHFRNQQQRCTDHSHMEKQQWYDNPHRFRHQEQYADEALKQGNELKQYIKVFGTNCLCRQRFGEFTCRAHTRQFDKPEPEEHNKKCKSSKWDIAHPEKTDNSSIPMLDICPVHALDNHKQIIAITAMLAATDKRAYDAIMQHDNTMRPKVGVAALIYRDGKVLMTKRHGSHGAGTWSVPGGHLEFGESWEECIKRETMEEVGVEISNIQFLEATNDIFESEGKHYVTIWLTADWVANEPESKEPEKIIGVEWSDLNNLPSPLFEPCWTNLRATKPELFVR
jgi:8-oxo-dGTP diphosphatase